MVSVTPLSDFLSQGVFLFLIASAFFLWGWFSQKVGANKLLKTKIWCACNNEGVLLDVSSSFCRFFSLDEAQFRAFKKDKKFFLETILSGYLSQKSVEDLLVGLKRPGASQRFYGVHFGENGFMIRTMRAWSKQPVLVTVTPLNAMLYAAPNDQKTNAITLDQQILSKSTVPVACMTLKLGFVYANDAWKKLYGPCSQMAADAFAAAEPDFHQAMMQVRRTGLPISASFKKTTCLAESGFLLCPDRSDAIWAFGFPLEVLCCLKDQEKKHKDIMDHLLLNLNLGLAVLSSERRIRFFNPLFSRFFRLEHAWLTGTPSIDELLEKLRETRQLPDVVDFGSYLSKLKSLLSGADQRPQEEIIHLSDSRILRLSFMPYLPGELLFMCEDMTEKINLVQKKQESDYVLEALSSQSSEGIVVLGSDCRVRFLNQACIGLWGLDFNSSDCLGILAWDLIRKFHRQFYAPQLTKIYIQKTQELLNRRMPGAVKVLMSGGRVLNCAYFPMMTDEHLFRFSDQTSVYAFSEVQLAAKHLFSAQDYRVASGVSDLKKYCAAQSLSFSQNGLDKFAQQQAQLKQSSHKTFVPTDLVAGALERFSQGFFGQKQYGRDACNLGEVLDQCVGIFQTLILEKKLILDIAASVDLSVIVDREALDTLLRGLLVYVLEEVAEGTRVRIGVASGERSVTLAIKGSVGEENAFSGAGGDFRLWRFGLGFFHKASQGAGCTLRSFSVSPKRLHLGCVFPLSVVQAQQHRFSRNVLRFSSAS